MLNFILRRSLILIPFLFLISIISFTVIQLPPGTYVDTYVNNLKLQGGTVSEEQKASIEAMYGLDKSLPVQYGLWITNIVLRGNFGNSFRYNRPVTDILQERIRVCLKRLSRLYGKNDPHVRNQMKNVSTWVVTAVADATKKRGAHVHVESFTSDGLTRLRAIDSIWPDNSDNETAKRFLSGNRRKVINDEVADIKRLNEGIETIVEKVFEAIEVTLFDEHGVFVVPEHLKAKP